MNSTRLSVPLFCTEISTGFYTKLSTACRWAGGRLGPAGITNRVGSPVLRLLWWAGGRLKPGFGLSGDVHMSQSQSCEQRWIVLMPWGLRRFQHSGQSHFVTFCCYHRPIRLLRCARSLRAGSFCSPPTQADESLGQRWSACAQTSETCGTPSLVSPPAEPNRSITPGPQPQR
jgi:hypothetical protein